MPQKRGSAAASSSNLEELSDDSDPERGPDANEDSNPSPIDPFSTKEFRSKRRRGFRQKPRLFTEDDLEALQQLACAEAFSKFHTRIRQEASKDNLIGDHLKTCALQATKLRHCRNEFLEQDDADKQIENYYKDRLEEYATLSNEEFLRLAERFKSDIHHTIDKWLKKRSKSRSHAKKSHPGEYKRNMLSDALKALVDKDK